jgi:chromatin segregation and condensation protein Rec8/ScpA/Scc1 (kleisin family)
VWLAAHWAKKLTKQQVTSTDVKEHVEAILAQEEQKVPLALRLSGHLLVGVVRIFSRQVAYLYVDASEAVTKIRKAFRNAGGAAADVDLPENQALAKETAITLRAAHDDADFSLRDVEVDLGELLDPEAVLGSQSQQLNVAEARDITMRASQSASEYLDLGYSQPFDDNLPGAGGDWEIELGRAGELDQNAPVAFDEGDVQMGDALPEDAPRKISAAFEQDRDFFADPPAGGLLDESMAAAGRLSVIGAEGEEERPEGAEQLPKRARRAAQKKKPAQRRKRKNAMSDEQTQLSNEEMMRRIQGGDDAIEDVFRDVELIDPAEEQQQQQYKQQRLDLADDLQQLLQAPFELDDGADDEEVVELPPSQSPPRELDASQRPLELGHFDDAGDAQPMDVDYGAPEQYVEAGLVDEEVVQLPPSQSQQQQQGEEDPQQQEQAEEAQEEEEGVEGPLRTVRSRQFRAFLNYQFDRAETVSFDAMVENKNRSTVAGSFYELLLFKTHNVVDLKQEAPFGDIEITLVK